ncbi:MAG: NUDIX hydrolase [Candidatus Limnocylindria bacterium]
MTDERPRQSAVLLALDGEGRVLLVQQRGGPYKGAWLLPGGGLEEGESFEEALRREVVEETCLEVTDPREIARYDVHSTDPAPFHFRVRMYRGDVSGEPRPGPDGEAVAWVRIDPASAHPVLLRQLRDADVMDLDHAEIEGRCAAMGIQVRGMALRDPARER